MRWMVKFTLHGVASTSSPRQCPLLCPTCLRMRPHTHPNQSFACCGRVGEGIDAPGPGRTGRRRASSAAQVVASWSSLKGGLVKVTAVEGTSAPLPSPRPLPP